MADLNNHRQHLAERIPTFAVGSNFSLAQLFGDGWERVGTIGERRDLGTQFYEAVEQNEFPSVEFREIARSGRHNVYQRV